LKGGNFENIFSGSGFFEAENNNAEVSKAEVSKAEVSKASCLHKELNWI
jgi:hypothetical protein